MEPGSPYKALTCCPCVLCVLSVGDGAAPGSPFKAAVDGNAASDSSCDAAILSAFHLSSLFARREDGKTLAERLSQADLSVTPTKKQDPPSLSIIDRLTNTENKLDNSAMSLMERLSSAAAVAAAGVGAAVGSCNGSAGGSDDVHKSLAERLAQSELGQDLTITQVNAGSSGSVMHLNNNTGITNYPTRITDTQEDSLDSKEGIVKFHHNSDSDNADTSDRANGRANSQQLYEAEGPVRRSELHNVGVTVTTSNNSCVGKVSPVPDLVKLQQTLGLSNEGRCWEVEVTRRGLKRKGDSSALPLITPISTQVLLATTHGSLATAPLTASAGRLSLSPAPLLLSCDPASSQDESPAVACPASCTDRDAADESQYSQLKLSNAREKAHLIKVQLENEYLKKELLLSLISKIKDGDALTTLLALKTIVS